MEYRPVWIKKGNSKLSNLLRWGLKCKRICVIHLKPQNVKIQTDNKLKNKTKIIDFFEKLEKWIERFDEMFFIFYKHVFFFNLW